MKTDVFIESGPEVLTFNLNWLNQNEKPTDIMRLLLSIPDTFTLSELYSSTSEDQNLSM